ncbi:MAG: LysR family transcriptional regulator [Bradyrhizobium sp.]|uniref:LysR family transcriptional regulator n=1 Tax=Bradyrhizobium sp. TaxID=376 RepID=UPI001C2903DD|nr:LysR family transcriptional regulator [Bradyrhizobium sp.]MBU6463915.1 LysR family transcriptional regulator [Pseudomonadota bacterium]MDE2067721.1 LysR family transcriptional regulator [Bradyrhizobium sp.]MDE2242055.1 LysR family transcriptional regulator [Bradyrhizobium sp.]MDE2471656.1 LysR family transcriptional regulator [Bradyrhizobium sp.]
MHPPERRGARAGAHPPGRMADWDLVRIFLEVARIGSFRAASEQLNMSANYLSKRISLLERAYKTTLMTRHVDGIRLTPEGLQVLEAAKRMEEASFGLDCALLSQAAPALSGEVRLAVTEGLGTFWLAPRLVEFQRAYPGLLVDLKCEMRSADVLRLEADVAVQLEHPDKLDLKRVKIGRLHIMPFVSPAYVEIYGMPKSADDIRQNHRIVLQDAEQTRAKEMYDKYAGREQLGFVAMRNNVSTAHLWSIAKGAGIGWLPTYVPALGDPLIPLDIGVKFELDIWLAYHPDANKIPRVRHLIDWTVQSFDGRKYPWFSDEFVHPKDLQKSYKEAEPLVNLFAGFKKVSRPKIVPIFSDRSSGRNR